MVPKAGVKVVRIFWRERDLAGFMRRIEATLGSGELVLVDASKGPVMVLRRLAAIRRRFNQRRLSLWVIGDPVRDLYYVCVTKKGYNWR